MFGNDAILVLVFTDSIVSFPANEKTFKDAHAQNVSIYINRFFLNLPCSKVNINFCQKRPNQSAYEPFNIGKWIVCTKSYACSSSFTA